MSHSICVQISLSEANKEETTTMLRKKATILRNEIFHFRIEDDMADIPFYTCA